VVANHPTTPTTFYPAAVRAATAATLGPCIVDAHQSLGRVGPGSHSQWLNQPLAPNRIVDVYEADLVQGQSYQFRLVRTAGTTDLEFEIFSPSALTSRAGLKALSHPVSASEDQMSYLADATGRHPIVVYRPTGVDAQSYATYDFYWLDHPLAPPPPHEPPNDLPLPLP